MMRLEDETPAKKAFYESLKPQKRKVGKPAQTWIKTIENDLKIIDINLKIDNKTQPEVTIDFLKRYTNDRLTWKKIVQDIMMGNH